MPERRLALSVFNRRDKFLLIVLLLLRVVLIVLVIRGIPHIFDFLYETCHNSDLLAILIPVL